MPKKTLETDAKQVSIVKTDLNKTLVLTNYSKDQESKKFYFEKYERPHNIIRHGRANCLTRRHQSTNPVLDAIDFVTNRIDRRKAQIRSSK